MKPVSEIDASALHDGRIGIIDIGSNSIRLVVYDQQKRAPVSIYNEKVMCALGKGLGDSGMLNPSGVEMAKETLKRFLALGRNMDIHALHVMATAAVRDAKDGTEFAQYLEKTHGIDIDIISGNKEAKLGAYGVCASMYRPKGVTGDLGGGSMELVFVDDGHITDNASVLLGSLRMVDESKGDRDKLKKIIDKRFDELSWLKEHKAENFYAIGGSFRALAKMHMAASDYPLRILHEYTVDAKEFARFVHDIAEMSESKLEKFPGVAPKRISALPGAAMILERILAEIKSEYIIFSTSGIREGYLYEKLPAHIRAKDGLLASCTEFATKSGKTTAYANELFDWQTPLIEKESEARERLRRAFCLLTDIGLHIHPEYRAEWSFHRIVDSALTGLTHRERVTLALALYHRYQYKLKTEWPPLKLLQDSDRKWARLIGSSANLAYHITGSIAGSLHKMPLVAKGSSVELELSGKTESIMGDAVKRRIDALSEAFKEAKK